MSLLIKGLAVMGLIAICLTLAFVSAPRLVIQVMGGMQYGMAHAYVALVGIEMTLFALVYILVYYQISLGHVWVVWPLVGGLVLGITLLIAHHSNVREVLMTLISVLVGLLIILAYLSWRTFVRHSHSALASYGEEV